MTTAARVYFKVILQFVIAILLVSSCHAEDIPFAHYRHVDVGAVVPLEAITNKVTLLTDQEFAPFSFLDAQGKMVGLSVDIARMACVEARLTCEIKALPFSDLVPALVRGEGDAIISGLRSTPELLAKIVMTRPYYFSGARFIIRLGMPFETPDIRSLAGRRIGYVKATSHQAFLEGFYDRSALTPFGSEMELFEALRTGKLDAAFADSLHADYWLKGTTSRSCCASLGKVFFDRTSFTRGLSFYVRQDRETLRALLDYALDQMEESGETAKIMAHYLPASPL